jgi:glycosidase
MTPPAESPDSSLSEKVVIQLGSRTIKGYLDSPAWNTVEELLSHAPHTSPETFRVRHLESDMVEEISAKDIKAVFYVNSFEGDSDHQHLNFYSRAPIVHGIWMRLQFLDGEVMEGMVYNSLRYLVDPGFFVLPTDPDSNNKLVYVRKNWLADHRVLGMRKL